MLWLQSLRRPRRQPPADGALPVWGKLLVLAYLLGWLALGVALYAYWWDWSAPVKYPLALLEALLAPDLSGIRSVFSRSRP